MIREAPAVKVRQNLGELLNEVQYKRDSVVILKDGKPVAALIDIDLFERIRAMEARFTELTGRIQAAFADVSDDELDTLIDDAVKHARRTPPKTRRAK